MVLILLSGNSKIKHDVNGGDGFSELNKLLFGRCNLGKLGRKGKTAFQKTLVCFRLDRCRKRGRVFQWTPWQRKR